MRPRKQPQTQSMLLTAEMLADRGFRLAGIEGGSPRGCGLRDAVRSISQMLAASLQPDGADFIWRLRGDASARDLDDPDIG